jgi:hypothetical protein
MLSLIETGLHLPLIMPVLMLDRIPRNLTTTKTSRLVELDHELRLLSLVVFGDHLEAQQELQGGPTVGTKHHGPYSIRWIVREFLGKRFNRNFFVAWVAFFMRQNEKDWKKLHQLCLLSAQRLLAVWTTQNTFWKARLLHYRSHFSEFFGCSYFLRYGLFRFCRLFCRMDFVTLWLNAVKLDLLHQRCHQDEHFFNFVHHHERHEINQRQCYNQDLKVQMLKHNMHQPYCKKR